jgi:hypothetical protein
MTEESHRVIYHKHHNMLLHNLSSEIKLETEDKETRE